MAIKIQVRRDIAADWATANPILADGEFGFETDTGRIKIGDGVTSWNSLAYRFEGVTDHGALTGLADDDHLQYLNETRHDALPSDNPHGVTATQVGLGNVPNIDATDRLNHVGTQLASTISDFATQVAIDETTTSISLVGNNLTYVDEDGASTVIDLSLYLDDTNLARLVSGTLNPTTGIVTFTRDDSSTFTIDMSALLDNQNASEVPFTPTGNTTSTDVQAAIVEVQTDVDNNALAIAANTINIASNDSDILTLQNEQTTQNTNISTNQTDISNLQASQGTQDSAIALNTAKVSADGSIDTHSDVDISTVTPSTGDTLEWNGSNFVPTSIDNGFTIFPIWAEENGGLGNNQYEWSWGNGAVGSAIGIVIPFDCEIFSATFNAETFGTSVSIDLELDGTIVTTPTFTTNNSFQNFTAIPVTAGQRLGFRTNTVTGGMTDARVCAWCRVASTALFPTPDRMLVNGSNIAFTSTTFAPIPGISTTVSLSDTGTVDGMVNYSALRSGGTNAITQFRVVINGNNGQSYFDTLSTFNDNGSAAHFVESLPAGTYTVTAEALTDQPITITSIGLTATAVEA